MGWQGFRTHFCFSLACKLGPHLLFIMAFAGDNQCCCCGVHASGSLALPVPDPHGGLLLVAGCSP